MSKRILTLNENEFFEVIANRFKKYDIDYELIYFIYKESINSVQVVISWPFPHPKTILSTTDLMDIVKDYIKETLNRVPQIIDVHRVKSDRSGNNFRAKILL